jgi:hypothetical protein
VVPARATQFASRIETQFFARHADALPHRGAILRRATPMRFRNEALVFARHAGFACSVRVASEASARLDAAG